MKKILVYAGFIYVCFLSGCGYHFIGQDSEVLSSVNAIAIPYFANKSYQSGLERYVTEALVDEFVRSRIVSVVTEGDADAVIRGTIEDFRQFVVSVDKDNKALEYRTMLTLDVTLERKDTGEVLWRNRRLVHFEDYRVSNEIATTEANREEAIRLASLELAKRIHNSIVEGF